MLNFLKPTKQKILGTIIILIALLIGSLISEQLIFQLPTDKIPFENNLDENLQLETVQLGLKNIAIELGIKIVMIYLSMCLIFRKKGKM